ncbi:MAG: hypothetical protein AVDCRST_MAG50-2687, partial [uncultured Acidimicrobiales bacterium]
VGLCDHGRHGPTARARGLPALRGPVDRRRRAGRDVPVGRQRGGPVRMPGRLPLLRAPACLRGRVAAARPTGRL